MYLRRRAELLSEALKRTLRRPPSLHAKPNFNKAAAFRWMQSDNIQKVGTTDADRFFMEIISDIMNPTTAIFGVRNL